MGHLRGGCDLMAGALNVLMGGISLTALAVPTPVSGVGSGTVTTGVTNAVPVGGESPFIYSWSQVSGDAMTITSPTGSSTAFQKTGVVPSDAFSGVFQCLVTDNAGRTTTTNTVTANITGV